MTIIHYFSQLAGAAWRGIARLKYLNFAHPAVLGVLAALVLGILLTSFAMGMQLGQRSGRALSRAEADHWAAVLSEQKVQLAAARSQLQEKVDALAMRLGQINAHILRLDALGKQLTEMANIDHREFDFDNEPALGGPENTSGAQAAGTSAEIPDLTALLDQLERRVELRSAQLAALESVILARQLKDQTRPGGRPVEKGFISSHFGSRQDPFSGHQAFHTGVDFAGASGSKVVAVAAGIVTWVGTRAGYGSLVEVSHGDGLITRYAHNQRALVNVGQTVKRGEPIALMGSTGRSTGPHVHFEVLRHGKQVNPLTFTGR